MTFYQNSSRPLNTNCNGSCGSGSSPQWVLGDIAAGQTKVIYAHYFIGSGATEGLLTHSTSVIYDGISSAIVKEYELTIDFSASAEISVAAKHQQVLADGNIDFELSYGNIGNSGWVATELKASIPAGTTFVSASDGGTVLGSDVVWSAGVSNAGTSSKRFYTVRANNSASSGTLYTSKVTVGNNGADLASAKESVVVKSDTNLTLDVTITGDTRTPSQYSYYRYVVANKGNVSMTDVKLNVLTGAGSAFTEPTTLPRTTGCNTYCEPYEVATLAIGQLDAGESRVLLIPVYSRNPVDGAPWITHVSVTENSGSFTLGTKPTVSYGILNEINNPQLVVEADTFLVAANQEQTFSLNLGNVTGTTLINSLLSVTVPDGYQFVSASGQSVIKGRQIFWPIGNLLNRHWANETVVLSVDSGLSDGEVLILEGELRSGDDNELVARSSVSSVVKSALGLSLDVTGTYTPPLSSGDTINIGLDINNQGNVQLADIDLNVMVPIRTSANKASAGASGCSGNTCEVYEWANWDIGNLDPEQSSVNSISPQLYTGNNAPVNGSILTSNILVTQGSLPKNDIVLIRSWGVGTEFQVNTNHDSDGDLIPDWWEIKYTLNRLLVTDALLDGDDDQLSNLAEYQAGTDPTNEDTDGDGINDGDQLEMGTGPLDPGDCSTCGPKSWWRFKLMQPTL
jgi:hypothetical protein